MIRKLFTLLATGFLLSCTPSEPEIAIIKLEDGSIVCERCVGVEGFGSTIAADNGILAVKEDPILHLFGREGNTTTSIGQIIYDNGVVIFDIFLRNDTLIYGLGETDGSSSVYFFLREGTNWREAQKIRSNVIGDGFGTTIDMQGQRLVISAPFSSGGSGGGKVYVYEHEEEQWALSGTLASPDPDSQDQFGLALAVYDDVIIAGSTNTDLRVYTNNGSEWEIGSSESIPVRTIARSGDLLMMAVESGSVSELRAYQVSSDGSLQQYTIEGVLEGNDQVAGKGEIVAIKGERAVFVRDGGDKAYVLGLEGTEWRLIETLQPQSRERSTFDGVDLSDTEVYLGGYDLTSDSRLGYPVWRVYYY